MQAIFFGTVGHVIRCGRVSGLEDAAFHAPRAFMEICRSGPFRLRTHPADPVSADLGRKQRAKSIPPEPHRFVADIDPTLVQKILHIAKRKRDPDLHHHRQADDLVLYRIWLPGCWKPLPATPFMAGSGGGWIEMIWVGWTVPEYDQPPSSPRA